MNYTVEIAEWDAEDFQADVASGVPVFIAFGDPSSPGARVYEAVPKASEVPTHRDDLDGYMAQDGGTARYVAGDGWYVEGRVPGPWRDVVKGPFETAREAGEEGHRLRLGGRHLFQVREGRRVV